MTQFVFKRRDIQIWLDAICEKIPLSEGQKLAKKLNTSARLETMWEVAFLKEACKESGFRYEESLPNGKKPDFHISVDAEGDLFSLYGDITTLSDEGIDAKNPIYFFMQELERLRNKNDLQDLVLEWRVGHKDVGIGSAMRRELMLPKKGNIPSVIKRKIIPVLKKWKAEKPGVITEDIETDGLSLKLTHRPDRQSSSGGYAGYQAVGRAEHSPLFQKLKDKKKQLSAIPKDALNIILICDADSDILQPRIQRGVFSLHAEDVCRSFLEKHTTLDVIAIIAVENRPPQPGMGFPKRLNEQLFIQRPDRRKSCLTSARINAIEALITKWVQSLPLPRMTPDEARRQLKNNFLPSPRGGFNNMSERTVEISSRRVSELLAGICSPKEWKHDFEDRGPNPAQFFLNNIMSGRMIKSVKVKPMEGEDDDWLEITFGNPDPAMSPFVAKKGD